VHRFGRVHLETAPLPHQQQAERVVELSVGEQHGLQPDHSAVVGMQVWEGLDL